MDDELLQKLIHDGLYPSAFFLTYYKVWTSIKLVRNFKPKDISEVCDPVKTKKEYTGINLRHINNKKLKDIALNFSVKLIKEFPLDSLNNLYNNINTVSIKSSAITKLLGIGGSYAGLYNRIRCGYPDSLYHELFHLSSTVLVPEKGIHHSGFSQKYYTVKSIFLNDNIGESLTEGYTALLSERYFGKKAASKGMQRKFEVYVADKVEKIIGQKKMENLYLNANLKGLLDELKKYSSEEEAMKFICSFDLISDHYADLMVFKSKRLQKSLENVHTFLLDAYKEKLTQDLCSNSITQEEYETKYDEFLSSLKEKTTIPFWRYYNMPKEEKQKVLKK